MFFYLVYKLGQFLVRILSLAYAYKLAEMVAKIRYYFALRDKRIIAENIEYILKAKGERVDRRKIEKLSKECYINFGKFLVEFFKFSKIDENFIKENIKIQIDSEKIDRLFAKNKGLIGVGAHLGNWEIGAALLASLGYKVNSITLAHSTKLISRFFDGLRESLGVKVIPTGVTVKRCFKALADNEMVCFAGDKNFSGSGVKVKFMSRETVMPKGPAVFSLKTGAPIVMGFLLREQDNSFRMIMKDFILPKQTNNYEEDVKRITQQCSYIIEEYIKKYPTQWLMFHKIWD